MLAYDALVEERRWLFAVEHLQIHSPEGSVIRDEEIRRTKDMIAKLEAKLLEEEVQH